MKGFIKYLKKRPLSFTCVIILLIIYTAMLFSEFIAPYTQNKTNENKCYHPINISITKEGLVAKEAEIISLVNMKYAFIKGKTHKVNFFVKGEQYKLFGFIPCNIHLFGVEDGKYPVFILGSDNLGRDIFSRLMFGSKISLTIGFVATLISLLLAGIFGVISGYFGGKLDNIIMRGSEFLMLIPSLYLILFIRSLFSSKLTPGSMYIINTLILSFISWPGSARTIRGIVHSIKNEDYVKNAKLEGLPSLVIIFKYIIPQMSGLIIVSTMLSIPGFIMSETTLSYLGLGITDPSVSWGSMINRSITSISNLINYPWLLSPLWALLVVTLSFNFFGDALRDYFDPYHAIFKTWKKKKGVEVCCPQENDAILEVHHLSVEYLSPIDTKEDVKAVKDISFSLKSGQVLGIVGESGSGKTDTCLSLTHLIPNNALMSGSIFYKGKDISNLNIKKSKELMGKEISLIFQDPISSFDPLQTIENVFFEVFQKNDKNISKEESIKKTLQLLEMVHLQNPELRLKNYPHQFSGGELQRINIALSLCQNCSILIADEITTNLDIKNEKEIITLLKELIDKQKLSVIFISHNINLVKNISDKIIVMQNGKIVETGLTNQVLTNPQHSYTKALIDAMPKINKEKANE